MSKVTIENGLRVLHITKEDLKDFKWDGHEISKTWIDEIGEISEEEFDRIQIKKGLNETN